MSAIPAVSMLSAPTPYAPGRKSRAVGARAYRGAHILSASLNLRAVIWRSSGSVISLRAASFGSDRRLSSKGPVGRLPMPSAAG